MTTVCMECGETIESRSDLIEGIKTILHARNNHPNLYKLFNMNHEMATATGKLASGEVVHFLGENYKTEDEDGNEVIEFPSAEDVTLKEQ